MGIFGDVLGGIGGFVGDLAGQDNRDQAAADLANARKAYQGLNPTINAPTEQAVTEGRSNYYSADPATRAAQMQALTSLQDQARSGGLTAIDRARMQDITNQTDQAARTQQAEVQQQAQQRGMANSGTSLVAQQMAGQNAAQQGAQNAIGVGAAAMQGRMAALQGAAGLAGGIRGQDYQAAGAQDSIDRFNAANSQGVNSRNVDRNMQAQQGTFSNSLGQAGGIAGTYGAEAAQANAQADATRRRWAALGQGVGAAGDGIAAAVNPAGAV